MKTLHRDRYAEATLINYTKCGEAFPHYIATQKLTNSRNGGDKGFYLTQSREPSGVVESTAGRTVLELFLIVLCLTMAVLQLTTRFAQEPGRAHEDPGLNLLDPSDGTGYPFEGFLYLGDERAFYDAFGSVHGTMWPTAWF